MDIFGVCSQRVVNICVPFQETTHTIPLEADYGIQEPLKYFSICPAFCIDTQESLQPLLSWRLALSFASQNKMMEMTDETADNLEPIWFYKIQKRLRELEDQDKCEHNINSS